MLDKKVDTVAIYRLEIALARGSRDRYPGKSVGTLPGCVEMGSGRPRDRWS